MSRASLALLLLLVLHPALPTAQACNVPGSFRMSVHPSAPETIEIKWDTVYTVPELFFRASGEKEWTSVPAHLMKADVEIGGGVQEVFVALGKGGACMTSLGFIQTDRIKATFAVKEKGETTVIVDVRTREQRENVECSVDGGSSYPVRVALTDARKAKGVVKGRCTMTVPGPGLYDVWVRWGNGDHATHIEEVAVGSLGRLMAAEKKFNKAKMKSEEQKQRLAKLRSISEKLKGAVGQVSEELVSSEVRVNELVRGEGTSGMVTDKSGSHGVKPFVRRQHRAGAVHNHNNHVRTLGMGEYQAVLNGVQFQTRHNDYKLRQPHSDVTPSVASASFPPVSMEVEHPPVPPSVLEKETVKEQMTEMMEYFRAFKDQNVTHRDYRPYFRPVMSILEGTWTESRESVTEPFESDRHFIDADSWEQLSMKSHFYANSGKKNPDENVPYLPSSMREVRRGFEPVTGQWFYRVICQPLKGDLPTARFRLKDELHHQMGGKPKTKRELTFNRGSLFELRPELEREKPDLESKWPKERTDMTFLDELMRQFPGFDGPQQVLKSGNGDDVEYDPNDESKELNTAFYSRFYSLEDPDSKGKKKVHRRGFRDNFWAAQTANKRVSPQRVCKTAKSQTGERPEECKKQLTAEQCSKVSFTESDPLVSGRCKVVNGGCIYQECAVQRWTYAIPLEIVYMTPLTEWNPYNISMMSEAEQLAGGKTGAKDKPLNGAYTRRFLRTPTQFFGRVDDDPADTAPKGGRFVLGGDGTAHRVLASGYRITHSIAGVGLVRQRYPIFTPHDHDGQAFKEVKALQEVFVGDVAKNPKIREIIRELRKRK